MAYISNNSFIDGITHRQMRKSILETFDKIYILDLHGNSRKKESSPDKSKDENVFDIMQGVSINIFIKKKSSSKNLAEVFHYDLFGKRDLKYEFLNANNVKTVKWNKLNYSEPYYFFVPKNFNLIKNYEQGFLYSEIFNKYSAGIKTKVDHIAISFDTVSLKTRVKDILDNNLSILSIAEKYGLNENTTWEYKPEYKLSFNENKIVSYSYRPLDNRFIYNEHKFLSRSRQEVMKHLLFDNIALSVVRQSKIDNKNLNVLITTTPTCEDFITNHTFTAPLYLYPDEDSLTNERTPNLNLEIIKEIEENLGLKFVNEKEQNSTTFSPIDILDYIYAVLHSPNYREKYKEFLKIDFPRVPYPDISSFWQFVNFGGKLRALHLLEDSSLDNRIIDIKGEAELKITNSLNKKDFSITNNKVALNINDEVSIINIPLIAWEFYIGGYQPAQKWLKDRTGSSFD